MAENNNINNRATKLNFRVILIYLLGGGFWFLVWYFVGGYQLMSSSLLLWFPFLACFVIFAVNTIGWKRNNSHENYKVEMEAIEFVERNAAHMVIAITGILLVAAEISMVIKDNKIPQDFLIFQSAAFICAVVGVLPLVWIPSDRPYWLVILRHIKTVPFTYAISLFLGGIIKLLSWINLN